MSCEKEKINFHFFFVKKRYRYIGYHLECLQEGNEVQNVIQIYSTLLLLSVSTSFNFALPEGRDYTPDGRADCGFYPHDVRADNENH